MKNEEKLESEKIVHILYGRWMHFQVFKILIVLLFVFLFFTMGSLGQNLEYDSSASIDKILKEDDPYLQQYDLFKEDFGSNENIVIAFETDTIYNNDFLTFLIGISELLRDIEGVQDLISLSTLSDIYGKDGELIIAPFIQKEKIPYSRHELDGMKAYFNAHPFVKNRLVDRSGETAVLYVQIAPEFMKDDLLQERIANSIENATGKYIIETEKAGARRIKAHFVGGPIVSSKISEIQRGEGWITFVMIVALAIILSIVFRSFSGTVLPLFIALASISFIMGLKTILHSSFSTIDGLLYALIFTISVGDSVHIISAWRSPSETVYDTKEQKMTSILNHVFIPCFFTSLTTAIGFGAISLSGIPQLKDFGIFASVAVIFAFIITMTLIPAVLTIHGPGSPGKPKPANKWKDSLFERSCQRAASLIHRITYNRPAPVIFIFIAVFCVAVFGITRIHVGTNSYSFLKDSTDVNVALKYIEDRVCGIDDLEIIIQAPGDSDEAFKQPENLKRIEAFQSYLETLASVSETNSLLYFIKLMNRALQEDPGQYAIPAGSDMVAQLIFLYEISGDADTLRKWVSFDFNALRINLKIRNNAKLHTLIDEIKRYSRENDFPFTYRLTGSAVIWNRVDSVFLKSQVKSLAFSVTIITFIMFMLFRSIRLGVISFLVNFFPIVVGFGILGFSGIGLNMGTVLIAPIAIGIAVDDTIHFLVQYRLLEGRGGDLREVFAQVFKIVFKPIVFTSVILAFGFSSNVVSNFKPNAYFGIVSAVTLLVAMASDLFLLPALLLVWRPAAKKKPDA